MSEETRNKILKVVIDGYPEFVGMKEFLDSTGLDQSTLEKHVKYLEEKGYLQVTWTSADFFAEATINAVEHVGEEIIPREIVKKILEKLYEKYPDYAGHEDMKSLLGLERKELRRPIKYLEDTGLVSVQWFMGGTFMIKINSNGIDQLENL